MCLIYRSGHEASFGKSFDSTKCMEKLAFLGTCHGVSRCCKLSNCLEHGKGYIFQLISTPCGVVWPLLQSTLVGGSGKLEDFDLADKALRDLAL